jgi:cytochrome P450
VLEMLDAIGSSERIKPWVDSALARGERLMGFGHRVYRVRDPRADVLKDAIGRLAGGGLDLPFAGEVEAYMSELLDYAERLTHAETVTMIANLLVAGHDTAGSQIPCSALVALQHREQLTDVTEDDARLASAASETMRLEPSIPIIPRTATAPIELHGTTIAAGSMVFLCIASACRDELAWDEPAEYRPDRFTRPDTAKLPNFGAGTHYCLGTSLARLTVEESLRAVLAADPALQLTEQPGDIPWRQVLGRSPVRLDVSPVG